MKFKKGKAAVDEKRTCKENTEIPIQQTGRKNSYCSQQGSE